MTSTRTCLPTPDEDANIQENENLVDHFICRMHEAMHQVFELGRTNLGYATAIQKQQYNKKSLPNVCPK